MKKFLSLTLVTLFILCGCGKKTETAQPAHEIKTETKSQSGTPAQDVQDGIVVTEDKELGEYAGNFITKYVAGGKFYIKETKISSDGNNETVELAVDGDKTASKTDGVSQIIDGDMLYLVMHDQKAVLTSPVADVMAKNMTTSLGIKNEQEAKQNLLGTGEESVNGTEYSFEEYKNGDEIIKYYFDTKTLKFIKHISSDGTSELYQIDIISTEIPTDFFTVPGSYKVQDLSSVATQVG